MIVNWTPTLVVRYRELHVDGDGRHHGNSGDRDSIHGSTEVVVTELMVDALFIHELK